MGLFYNKYVRLTLFLLIGILFVSVKGCDYIDESYGFPTVHLVYGNYWIYYGEKMLERGSSHLLKNSSTNLMINIVSIMFVWLIIEKLRNLISSKYLKIFDKSYGLVLWYFAFMCLLMSNTGISNVFEGVYIQFLLLPSLYLGFLIAGGLSYFGLLRLVDGEFMLPSSLNLYYSDGVDLIIRVGLFVFIILFFLLLFVILSIAQERKFKKRK